MNSLLKIEWLKLRRYPAFWWMLGVILLSYPGINYIYYKGWQDTMSKDSTAPLKAFIGDPFSFPDLWATVAFASSLFTFIPALLVIMFITNEYTYKTHRQNIIDGWSRDQFMAAKLVDVLILSIVITVLYVIVTLVIGFLGVGERPGNIWEGSEYILYMFLQTFSQLSLAFLVAFMIRKAFIALGVYIFYSIIVDNILMALGKVYADDMGRFLPIEVSDRLIPWPKFIMRLQQEEYNRSLAQHDEHIIYTIILTVIIWVICFRINKKRDL